MFGSVHVPALWIVGFDRGIPFRLSSARSRTVTFSAKASSNPLVSKAFCIVLPLVVIPHPGVKLALEGVDLLDDFRVGDANDQSDLLGGVDLPAALALGH